MRLATVEAWGKSCACRCGSEPDWKRLQIHEEPPRAHGGDPGDPLDCLPLTAGCHAKRTGELGSGKTLDILVLDPLARCRGPLVFSRMFNGRAVMSWVTAPWSQQRFVTLKDALTSKPR